MVEFTHEYPDARGDREKLRDIEIYSDLLDENSIVHATSHAGPPCVPAIRYNSQPDVTGRSGYHINLSLLRKLPPGRPVRIVYWIMN